MKTHNPYVCKFFYRIDKIIYRLKGKKCYWSNQGHLCCNGAEVKSHFSGNWHTRAADIQNKWFWTRKILSK